MLRHLKMELKRQEQQQQQQQQVAASSAPEAAEQQPQKQRRVRGRRSSKPQMEKRRRARINECLDILKTYVLTDSSNLTKFGIDAENRDEEAIARTILKSSGLINRHRGRKNPNKLEKADILELTVDYVRRLHEQRNQLLGAAHRRPAPARPLNQPLSLNLGARAGLQSTPPSPPPSSASSSPQPLLSISSNVACRPPAQEPAMALDLSESSRARSSWSGLSPAGSCSSATSGASSNRSAALGCESAQLMVVGADGVWRPWNQVAHTMGLIGAGYL